MRADEPPYLGVDQQDDLDLSEKMHSNYPANYGKLNLEMMINH